MVSNVPPTKLRHIVFFFCLCFFYVVTYHIYYYIYIFLSLFHNQTKMERTKDGLWSHFISLTQDEGTLKALSNSSHKNAWCKYCVEKGLICQLGDEENIAKFDFSSTWANYLRRQQRCMKDMKPIQGVKDLMAKHLHACEHLPEAFDKFVLQVINTERQSQSQLSELCQSILYLKMQPQSFIKAAKAKFHANFLRMRILIGVSYWSADQTNVQSFFEKWVGIKNLS